MKQIAQYQDGRLELQEVPCPVPPPGGVLVRTSHTVISVGTEKMKVEQARMNLLQKARARPDQVRKVLETARNLGWRSALEKVRNRLETPTPLGYSACGVVVETHPENTRFRVGDRVACAGAECAFHAEFLAVPDLLAAKVPDGVASSDAAYSTLCAIALQAVRQVEPRIGDRVLVMGQGLVGLLVTQVLTASGCRVMAVDLADARRPFSEAMGAEEVVILGKNDLASAVRHWTEGFGVDAAVICTATQSNAPIEQAAQALRDRGRMVDVGITRIELPWKMFYEKELDVRFSRSYGPGRYDPAYEWGGQDYPIGYVRWTEQRNMDACIHLMRVGRLTPGRLTTRLTPFLEAIQVYQDLTAEGSMDVGVVLDYQSSSDAQAMGHVEQTARPAAATGLVSREQRVSAPVEGLDVIGAGNFARTMLLPHLKGDLRMGTVVNQTSLSAQHVKSKFGFSDASTDHHVLWKEPERRAVLIATRHHLHAPRVVDALRAHRHVFVEKPLCLTLEELKSIDEALEASQGSVQVGFNRRFAPASVRLKQVLSSVAGPKTVVYRVQPGLLDPQHWYSNHAESGGRILGEACHFLDFFRFLLGVEPVELMAHPVGRLSGKLPFPDSVAAQMWFEGGSVAQLLYTAEGDSSYPKESVVASGSGFVAEITNFQTLTVHQGGRARTTRYTSKGHAEQMAAWVAFLKGARSHPLPYLESKRSMILTFAVLEALRKGGVVQIERPC